MEPSASLSTLIQSSSHLNPLRYFLNKRHEEQLDKVVLIQTLGKERDWITELIVQLALAGTFNLIAGDEWLPDRDTLYRSIRRYTVRLEETLEHPNLKRPKTYLQLLDALSEADMQDKPTLILNFLHHFYNADVELTLRVRTLQQCCEQVKAMSSSHSVVILIPRLMTEEYSLLFPILANTVDEIIPVAEYSEVEISQKSLFE